MSDLADAIRRKMESSVPPQSKEIKLHQGDKSPALIEEVIEEEILPRLPVKSLLQFRCVAKSWCSVIASRRLVKAHLKRSTKTSFFENHRIFFNSIDGFKHCSLPSLFNAPFTDSITSDITLGVNFQRPRVSVYLVGSCDGIVCILLDRKKFVLWNPTTKKTKKLPLFDYRVKQGSITKYGFGYDEVNDDYKVFGVLSVFCLTGTYIPVRKVYSLKTNVWEAVEGKDDSPFDEGGKYVSGKLHWGHPYSPNCGIDSFDLNSHVYGLVELPDFVKEYTHRMGIGVLNGCISLHCFYQGTHVDIWLMKEYGVKESWSRVVTVPYYRDSIAYIFPTPFAIWPNGEVLLYYGENFVIYNPNDGVFRHPRINNHALFLNLGIYVESVASVVPYTEQERLREISE